MSAGVYERAVGNSLLLVKAGFNCSLLKFPECHIKYKALQENMSFRAELKMNVEPRNKLVLLRLGYKTMAFVMQHVFL